jgi:DNA-directed RNA polymerase subunit alpha
MSIIKPNKLITYLEKDDPKVLQIIAEPLERGFGVTLGNSLRRVLLSSLQGAAVTFVKISGVMHEFQPLHGVKEDVTDIILNIKTMVVKMLSPDRQFLRIKAEGPCVVTAKMIEATSDVQIINPDHVICTLESNTSLEIEMVCEIGRGYLSAPMVADRNVQNNTFAKGNTVGYIAIDALFSPTKSVLYKVENTRVGQVTDYDKLTMTIETNGAITPEDALSLAAKILQEQFALFLIGNVQEYKVDVVNLTQPDMKFHPIMLKRVDSFGLSVRSQNCLRSDNIVYIADLVQKNEEELLNLTNFGKKSLDEIHKLLDNLNREFFVEKDSRKHQAGKLSTALQEPIFPLLSLGMKVPDWNTGAVEELVKNDENVTR